MSETVPAQDLWHQRTAPLPHALLDVDTGPGARVVVTLADRHRRPDLDYVADGTAASPEDRRRLASALDLEPHRLVFMEQVHGIQVADVVSDHAGAGLAGRATSVPGADAMVAGDRSLALVGLSADCPLVALWDGRAGLAGLAHAGWRGLAGGILGKLAARLIDRGADLPSLTGAVGPCIGPCCYEVGPDVLSAMAASGAARAAQYVRRRENGRTTLDLRGVALDQLREAGIDCRRVAVYPPCTMCRSDLFHSYRRDGAVAGRQAMAVRLRG